MVRKFPAKKPMAPTTTASAKDLKIVLIGLKVMHYSESSPSLGISRFGSGVGNGFRGSISSRMAAS